MPSISARAAAKLVVRRLAERRQLAEHAGALPRRRLLSGENEEVIDGPPDQSGHS
jgi:hypothetical protein